MKESTFQLMQSIEREAEEELKRFDSKIESYRQEMEQQFELEANEYDAQTELLVQELRQKFDAEIKDAKIQRDETIRRNEETINEALNQHKQRLIKNIVEQVVATYGN